MSKPEIMFVSPHRDDAAFSCGIAMCSILPKANVKVVNVFTTSAYAPFDPETEQIGVDAVVNVRCQEDYSMIEAVRSTLSARSNAPAGQVSEVSLGLLDAPLRLALDLSQTQGQTLALNYMEAEISSLASALSPILSKASYVFLPLGLGARGLEGHIDHRITREAGMRCSPLDRVAFYEDLPYAARMNASLRSAAISNFGPVAHGLSRPYTVTHPDGVSIKAALAGTYHSQIEDDTVLEMCSYAAERGGGEVIYGGVEIRSFLIALSTQLITTGGVQ